VLAQFNNRGGPPSASELYGAGPSTPPQMFQKPPPVAPVTPNLTANSTASAAPTNTVLVPTDTATGNTSTAVAGAKATGSTVGPLAPDLSNVVMPASPDLIDDQRVLAPGDQLVYQVVEDQDPPRILFVDENGKLAPGVPYLSQLNMKAAGTNLRQLAANISTQLANPDLHYYTKATVLLAPYRADNSRGHVTIDGQVAKPGQVPVPANNVLTILQALNAAGWFTASADQEHVQLIHNDIADSTKSTRLEYNIQNINEGKAADVIVQPGDFIEVLSKAENNSVITVTGGSPPAIGAAGEQRQLIEDSPSHDSGWIHRLVQPYG